MRTVRRPLAQFNDVFELSLPRRDSERHCALKHVRPKRRKIESPLRSPRGGRQLIGVVEIGDHNFCTELFQASAACVRDPHHGANREAFGKEFSDERGSHAAGRSGDEDAGFGGDEHGLSPFLRREVGPLPTRDYSR